MILFKMHRAISRVLALLVIGVIAIVGVSISFFVILPALEPYNPSLSSISVTPVSQTPLVTPSILSCNNCIKNIYFEFTVASTINTNTTVKVDSVSFIHNGKQVGSPYASTALKVTNNNVVQTEAVKLANESQIVLGINITTISGNWSYGDYDINISLTFGSPFDSSGSYLLSGETFTLINSLPNNIVAFVPIYLTNSQNQSTPIPYQQMLTLDNAKYINYVANNLQNIEFFDADGNILTSWLENGASSSSVSTYWVLLPNGIPAKSSTTIFLGFANPAVNLFDGKKVGEAPQLSPTFGEYNNIGQIMDPGLLYQIYYNPSGTYKSQNYQDAVYAASMINQTTIQYDPQDNHTLFVAETTPMSTPLTGINETSNTVCLQYCILGYKYNPTTSSYFDSLPIFPSSSIKNYTYSWILKAVGWVNLNVTTSFTATVNDGIGLGSSTTALTPFNGSDWLGGGYNPDNLLNTWVNPQLDTSYNLPFMPLGITRLEVDYYQFNSNATLQISTGANVAYYHPALPPNGIILTTILGELIQV